MKKFSFEFTLKSDSIQISSKARKSYHWDEIFLHQSVVWDFFPALCNHLLCSFTIWFSKHCRGQGHLTATFLTPLCQEPNQGVWDLNTSSGNSDPQVSGPRKSGYEINDTMRYVDFEHPCVVYFTFSGLIASGEYMWHIKYKAYTKCLFRNQNLVNAYLYVAVPFISYRVY